MMASENLNKGGRRRRAAAAESCGGGFPRSVVATTRALVDASPRFPPPPIRDGGWLEKGRGNFETTGDTSVYRPIANARSRRGNADVWAGH
ncbi:uncharacterized protein LOC116534826 isoform X2 [Sapajus apella]|uniref:Uncharacterized protein LOC116534826 isoform X2 n=1 Tax=Sapajus apella TaxID=9515 RepID=A0A6J3G1I5_SAPAP|nr:uncharacterized protein LOC116534826 isoform X2 [Sapajus apella]